MRIGELLSGLGTLAAMGDTQAAAAQTSLRDAFTQTGLDDNMDVRHALPCLQDGAAEDYLEGLRKVMAMSDDFDHSSVDEEDNVDEEPSVNGHADFKIAQGESQTKAEKDERRAADDGEGSEDAMDDEEDELSSSEWAPLGECWLQRLSDRVRHHLDMTHMKWALILAGVHLLTSAGVAVSNLYMLNRQLQLQEALATKACMSAAL